MEVFNPNIPRQIEALPADQKIRFACELDSIRGLRKPIRYLIRLVSDEYILSSFHFKEICHEFNGLEQMLKLVGIFDWGNHNDGFWLEWQRKCQAHPWLWHKDEDERAALEVTGGENLALVNIPVRVGFALQLKMRPLNSVVCRLVQIQATLLECATDPSGLIAAWKESPLNLELKHINCRVKPVDLIIDAGEVQLYRALIDPEVDKGVIVDVTMKLLKNSGTLGYKVIMTSGRTMQLLTKEEYDRGEVTSKRSQKEEALQVTVNPFGLIAVMIWNCKGYKEAHFHEGVREIVAKYHPALLIITNSRVSCEDGKEGIDPRPFNRFQVVEPVLGCGGALILWNADEVFVSFDLWNNVAFTAEVSTKATPYIKLL